MGAGAGRRAPRRQAAAGQTADGAARFRRAAARRPDATPGDVRTEVETEIVFRDGSLAIADRHAGAGHPVYVYQFDYTPAPDRACLGAAHCAELPFLFDTLDSYPASPMPGQPAADQWPPYQPADPATIRHFA
jgi:para-nitrobenzyl esterase